MSYPPPMEARVVLVDGPLSIFIHKANENTILAAYERLGKLVQVAALELAFEEISNKGEGS